MSSCLTCHATTASDLRRGKVVIVTDRVYPYTDGLGLLATHIAIAIRSLLLCLLLVGIESSPARKTQCSEYVHLNYQRSSGISKSSRNPRQYSRRAAQQCCNHKDLGLLETPIPSSSIAHRHGTL